MAVTVALTAVEDVFVDSFSSVAADNFDGTNALAVGVGTGREYRSLLRFDLSGIPADVNVVDAYLELTSRNIGGLGPDVTLTSIDAAWVESTVSWNTQPAFGAAGSVSVRSSDTYGGVERKRWSGLTSLAQSWINGSRANNGLHLRRTGGPSNAATFERRENADPAVRPVLTVVYNRTPGIPGAVTSPAPGATVAGPTTITHGAAIDADGDALLYSAALLFADNSRTTIRTHQPGTTFTHNFTGLPAQGNVRLVITAYDGALTSAERISDPFIINSSPNAPTLGFPSGGQTVDRNATVRLSHSHSDSDPGDGQSKADHRYRLIGAATWTTITASTSAQFRDFTAGTFVAGDYEWQVRTYDSLGTPSPWSASGFFTAEDAPPGPTFTAPVNGGTVDADPYLAQWSTPDQDAYQLRTVADLAGSPDTATVYTDTGVVESATDRSRLVAFPVEGRDEHLQIRERVDGLWSEWKSIIASVSYTRPALTTLTVLPGTASIGLTYSQPTPTGSQPVVTSVDVLVRTVSGVDQYRPVGVEVRLATGLPATGTWLDETPASDVEYEYAVRAFGANGTSSITAWTG